MYYEITKNGYCIEEGKIAALGKESSEGIRKISKKIYLTESTFDYLPFQIEIVGLNRKSVSDVWIDYKIIQKKEKIASNRGITDERGIYLDSLKYDLCSKKTFKPKLTYEANKAGYYPIDTTYKIRPDRSNKIKMTMISRTDYIHPLLVTNESASGLVSNVLDFIDFVILRSLLSDSILEYYSVNLQKFKNEYYITFKFDNKVVYNSLQLSKYDIAERLFDEVVRKILNPLNDNLGDSKQIFGYGLNIKAATKSFTNEDAVAESLVYDFYLPQNEVNSYKNLDITGQQLLDESIILLNGERIGLKLQ